MTEEDQAKKDAEEKKAKEEAETKAKDEADAAATKEKGSEEEQAIVKDAKDAATIAKEAEELKAKNLEEEKKLMDRKEALNALGGGSPGGTKTDAPKKLTDTEYAEALERGEVNPLKEDGFLK